MLEKNEKYRELLIKQALYFNKNEERIIKKQLLYIILLLKIHYLKMLKKDVVTLLY